MKLIYSVKFHPDIVWPREENRLVSQIIGEGFADAPVGFGCKEGIEQKKNRAHEIYHFIVSNEWVAKNTTQFKIFASRRSKAFNEYVSELGLDRYKKQKGSEIYAMPDQIISLKPVPLESLEGVVLQSNLSRFEEQKLLREVVFARTQFLGIYMKKGDRNYKPPTDPKSPEFESSPIPKYRRTSIII
ncbi:hypothetical protein HOC35_06715 [Candidatus Woesearchaeota archaeon]|jgi:hypothetical protein|nr:hypothetical protein [Candidatus Woesearchaeota archaeon]